MKKLLIILAVVFFLIPTLFYPLRSCSKKITKEKTERIEQQKQKAAAMAAACPSGIFVLTDEEVVDKDREGRPLKYGAGDKIVLERLAGDGPFIWVNDGEGNKDWEINSQKQDIRGISPGEVKLKKGSGGHVAVKATIVPHFYF